MAFHPDGSFEALEADSSDHLVPVSECNVSGLWGLDTTQNIQLNLYIDGGEVIYTWKAYSGPARLLSLDDSLGPVALVPVE
jgi:hypothetical protein